MKETDPARRKALLNYYKKLHCNNELYRLAMAEVKSRQFVINSLGYRGYGVNQDLLGALGFLGTVRGAGGALTERFYRNVKAVEETSPPDVEIAGADRVISELARKSGQESGRRDAAAGQRGPPRPRRYFGVMSQRRRGRPMRRSSGRCSSPWAPLP